MEPPSPTAAGNMTTPAIRVQVTGAENVKSDLRFDVPFKIGSDSGVCQVVLRHPAVSAVHAEVYYDRGNWWIRDLGSAQGIYRHGKRLSVARLPIRSRVVIGRGGPLVTLEIEGVAALLRMLRGGGMYFPRQLGRLFQKSRLLTAGEHKQILIRALRRFSRIQSRKYIRIIFVLGVVAVAAATYAVVKHEQAKKQQAAAREVFYQMKELELTLTRLELQVEATGDSASREAVNAAWKRVDELRMSYDRYVDELGVYSRNMDERDRTIYRIARVFGECEVNIPEGFVAEVKNYIALWHLSDKLPKAMVKARELGYTTLISHVLLANHLPPQYFFVALQESEFDSATCGPPTRFGIAKGMWQFIPSTAIHYGLRTGPLVQIARMDPRDERHRVAKSTRAAANYLRDIYSTEAQASGLLVLASYNWGHNQVRNMIRELPENPRDRNFWRFLEVYKDKVPKQTYDYVFYIFSAAVIGENPRLFGFSFDKPFDNPG